jgi:hypothetical protein
MAQPRQELTQGERLRSDECDATMGEVVALHDCRDCKDEVVDMDWLHLLAPGARQQNDRQAREHREESRARTTDAEYERGLHDGPIERQLGQVFVESSRWCRGPRRARRLALLA